MDVVARAVALVKVTVAAKMEQVEFIDQAVVLQKIPACDRPSRG